MEVCSEVVSKRVWGCVCFLVGRGPLSCTPEGSWAASGVYECLCVGYGGLSLSTEGPSKVDINTVCLWWFL